MLWNILKKDLRNRKVVNTILLTFITLSTIFLASSINNIIVVSSAVDYYLDYANVADVNMVTNVSDEKDEIETWLNKQKQKDKLTEFNYDEMLSLSNKAIHIKNGTNRKQLKNTGDGLYLGKASGVNNRVFDRDGNEFTLSTGEIAISVSLSDSNNLAMNDRIWLQNGTEEKEFVVKEIIKDAAFGNEMMGMSRFIVNDQEYDSFDSIENKIGFYNIETNHKKQIINGLNNQEYQSLINVFDRDTYKLTYSFDMLLSALLILVGICLILIALLVLRFTLVFTMEEQYQEIGILKAIGLKQFSIKKIYLIKYLMIVLVGASLGLLASLPISNIMIESVSYNMIMEDANVNIMTNLICTLFIIATVLLFCYVCTRKFNHISAVSAIRGGHTGERFGKRKGMALYKRKRLSVPIYLGWNDMLTHITRYAVLIVTFCISFILITIPLNTLNTMKSDEMASKFALDLNAKAYVSSLETENESKYTKISQLKDGMNRVNQQLQEKGYDTTINGTAIYFVNFDDGKNKLNLLSLQPVNSDGSYLTYSRGVAPKLANEVAISEDVMKQQGWEVGDFVQASVNNQKQDFLITGTYSDYMQLGKSARFSAATPNDQQLLFEYWNVMVYFDTTKTQAQVVKEMKKILPQYEWSTAQQSVDKNVGGIQNALSDLMIPMTVLLCILIMLITLLMQKLFIAREKGEIAMLKSIGFRNNAIRLWQIARMMFVAMISLLISIPLSMLSNVFILKPVFKIMGADVSIQVNALQAFLIYPAFLLAGIVMASMIASLVIKKIHIKDMSQAE